ncbi:hypothetical protein BABINDRAFT_6166 [Babjeviella inositovora NRRL Y-12698]|uniref:ferroxidase n=1 Tax=Babjeviella inositovora NRRL Y-12698 TaxID=984486 RepID=A0A1E3QUX9_9ASCO|nr:uncharacterized protein BABINDRAFT_6166 [Babjeviella inositovora NRRL Y-12698]ODQ81468.1 hypothetical protein BABINDRAFT_6166 [Babjeviella inositovora NRRL Y-12698]
MLRSTIRLGLQTSRAIAPLAARSTLPTGPTVSLSARFTRSYAAPKQVTTDGHDITTNIDEITINQYHKLADVYLESFVDEVEALGEQYPEIDIELTQGVMTFALPPNGVYVINKQPPNKQIWLSSPISGPKRYDLVKGQWTSLRDNSLLTNLMAAEIASALKIDFKFEAI